jgi:uroporphyrinogen decarboxylase
MTERENWLRTVEFRCPDWIPCSVSLAPLAWHTHRERLEDVVLSHPRLFPGFGAGSVDFDAFGNVYRQGERFTDNWQCVWHNEVGGLEGQVVEHPLADWDALEGYSPPDPITQSERGGRDWPAARMHMQAAKDAGHLVMGDGERLFDRLYFLRGFDNLMMDIATDDPRLTRLVDMLLDYETRLITPALEFGVDAVAFHTDIGAQRSLMISPEKFRKHIKPLFAQLFGLCRAAGAHVYLSSDGCVLPIVDDLIECGVSVHDPQYRANGLDGIERAYKGKLCANVDLDRQMFAFCTPQEITEHVRGVVSRMYLPDGGLMVSGSVWDANTPLENIEALCSAIEECCLGCREW